MIFRFGTLNRIIRLETRKYKLPWLAGMIVLDQTIGASTALSMFMITRSLIDGKSVEEIKERFRNDWLNTWKTGLHVWGPTQALNFYFVPLQLRVVRSATYGGDEDCGVFLRPLLIRFVA